MFFFINSATARSSGVPLFAGGSIDEEGQMCRERRVTVLRHQNAEAVLFDEIEQSVAVGFLKSCGYVHRFGFLKLSGFVKLVLATVGKHVRMQIARHRRIVLAHHAPHVR